MAALTRKDYIKAFEEKEGIKVDEASMEESASCFIDWLIELLEDTEV